MDELSSASDRGTTTLMSRPGRGPEKSTIALQYAVSDGCKKGESNMLFAFDETRSLLISRAENL
jgi:hypothetical protein